jgi:hypothetical protein
MLLTVPAGTDIRFKEYRPGIETRVRRTERRDVEDGICTRDIPMTGTDVRAYANGHTGHWELWQRTKAGWEYIVDWLGPHGEIRQFSETGMRNWLYAHSVRHVSRYEYQHRSALHAKRRKDKTSEHTASESERLRRGIDKMWGWRDHVGTE